jgi:hypothetical protein
MQGRRLVIGLLSALAVALGVVFWLGATGAGRSADHDFAASPADAGALGDPGPSGRSYDAGPSGHTIVDRRTRDELRRRIPPEKDGSAAVGYPIELRPDDPSEGDHRR